MPTDLPALGRFLDYRVPVSATLLVVALASIFVLPSQSASSFITYLLAIYCVCGVRSWRSLWFDPVFLLVAALLAYIPLTSLWSASWDGGEAASQAVRSILVLAFVVAVAESVQVDWFRERMTLILAVVGGIAGVSAIYVFFAESPEDGRLNGLGQLDAHVTAAFVYAVAALGGTSRILQRRQMLGTGGWGNASVGVAVACVVVLCIAVVLTGSRNAIACLVLGWGCLWIAHRSATGARFLVHGAVLAAVLLVVLVVSIRFVPGAEALILPRGDSFRPGIWSDYAARVLAEGPWFGLGVLTRDPIEVEGFPVLHQHGLFLAVAHQGGLLALGLMLTLVGVVLRILFTHYEEPEAKLGLAIWVMALPGYLLDGHELVDKIGWTWLMFWLPVGVAIGLRARWVLDDARRFGVWFR